MKTAKRTHAQNKKAYPQNHPDTTMERMSYNELRDMLDLILTAQVATDMQVMALQGENDNLLSPHIEALSKNDTLTALGNRLCSFYLGEGEGSDERIEDIRTLRKRTMDRIKKAMQNGKFMPPTFTYDNEHDEEQRIEEATTALDPMKKLRSVLEGILKDLD